MKKLFNLQLIALVLVLCMPAYAAQQTRTTYQSSMLSDFADNTTKQITPTKLRTQITNLSDSAFFPMSDILGTDSGGLGISWVNPMADVILFWDDSAGAFAPLTLGTNLSISGTTLNAGTGGGTTVTSTNTIGDNLLVRGDGASRGVQTSGITIDDSNNVSGVGTYSGGALTSSGLITAGSLTSGLITAGSLTSGVTTLTDTFTQTSTSANAIVSGANGTTNPTFKVDSSIASANTGASIIAGATSSGTGATIMAMSPSSAASITLSSKGTSNVFVTSPSGGVVMNASASGINQLQTGGSNRLQVNASQINMTPTTSSTAANCRLCYTGAANSSLTATTEFNQIRLNLGQINSHATGTLPANADMLLIPSTHAFSTASTATELQSFRINGAPIGGTNATVTTAVGLKIATATMVGTTNSYGLDVAPMTGATNNYAAKFTGVVQHTSGVTLPARVVTASGAITVTVDDYAVIVNKTTGAASAVSLPACTTATLGQLFLIKDGKNDSASNNITVTPTSGTIDGNATDVISTNGAAVTYHCDGTNYWKE